MVSRREFVLGGAAAAAARAASTDRFVRVSPRDARYLELSDGSPYIPVGLNLIAPPARGGMEVYRGWLDELSRNHGNYIRVWLSNAFWDTEHERSGVYDESRARLVDEMLEMSRARGIRVKMTIEHFRSIGGGTQAWADKPLHNVDHGGTARSMADFFDGERSRARFREKLAWLQKRFGTRPEIFAWELWNEINAVQGGGYLAWTEVMLGELHRLFPRNLCVQSLGSFDQDRVRETYRRHTLMPENDLAQVHRYLDLGASLAVCKGPVDVLAADAVREVAGYGASKPVLLAESGAVEPRHSGPFKLYARDREGTLLHDILFAPFFAGAAGAGQIWHWDSYVAPNGLWRHFGRFAEAVRGVDPAAEHFRATFEERGAARIYRLSGRRTTLIWVRDAASDWRAELERGEAPRTVAGLELELRGKVRAYDPWEGKWSTVKGIRGKVRVPEFRRSVVLRAG